MEGRLASGASRRKEWENVFRNIFLCLIDRYRKVALGRKKAGQNCQIYVVTKWKNHQKILIDFKLFLTWENETIFVEFPPLCFDDFYLLIVASRRATCNKTLPVRIFLNTEIASACDIP